ncbi:GlcNAc-PI de-N-acetylase [Seinonella peptonophila]|uniref:GlcNAc-PI de-N-acetylase n=1 Tax=Seinonella peptonophila TaxID=112248 RepID=A0A1M4XA14_9BACL|nr:PIG-L family deacetylase [Seinonella peptonophila]SHE90367.1 GlcNAc-PI de-N-acetylase [Seinonella peptonophila]
MDEEQLKKFVTLLAILLIMCCLGQSQLPQESPFYIPKHTFTLSELKKRTPLSRFHPSLSQNVVVYFSPHADDEVLTFGVPIKNDLAAHKKVYVVLLSLGEYSTARYVVNGRRDQPFSKPILCPIHHRIHSPKKEHFHFLNPNQFGRARVREFFLATTAMGIPYEQTAFYKVRNGRFPRKQVESIVKSWIHMFPNATFKSMSQHDFHIDHAMVGKVVNDLVRRRQIQEQAYYISIATEMKNIVKKNKKMVKLKKLEDRKDILKAVQIYSSWNPSKGYFGLGIHSVESQFDHLKKRTSIYQYSN